MSKNKELKHVSYNAEILEFGEVNDGFAKVLISVMSCDQIANGTKFRRSAVDNAVKGLNYLPVVGEWIGDKEDLDNSDFGTHGGKLTISDTEFKWEDTTIPYGVVIADSYHWRDMTKKNGEVESYLCVWAYLWLHKFPEIEKIYRDGKTNQSMEILVNDAEYTDSYYDIKDFSFQALCLLGKDIKPAFHEAQVITQFESNTFKAQYDEMLVALDKYMNKYEEKEGDIVENEEQVVDTQEEVEDTTEVENEVDETTDDDVEDEAQQEDQEETTEQMSEDETSQEDLDYKSLYEESIGTIKTMQENIDTLQSKVDEFTLKEERSEKFSMIEAYKGKIQDDTFANFKEKVDEYSKDTLKTELLSSYVEALESKANFTQEESKIIPTVETFSDVTGDDLPESVKLIKKYTKKQ